MSRFYAELDQNNTVLAILAVDDENCVDEAGEFSEQVGIDYLRDVYRDAVFVETRYDASIRRFVATIGGTYLPDLDEFRPERPGPDWIWNDDEGRWEDPNPPEPEPDET